jgi:phosphoribosylamine--glycine ligase
VKVLVLGSGAREHAIIWLLSKSSHIKKLYAAPGNAGTAHIAENLPEINPLDAGSVLSCVKNINIDFVFIGPEAPCALGVSDALIASGLPVIGPSKNSSQLEASKTFSKNFLLRHNIPTARAEQFSKTDEFETYIRSGTGKTLVVKKNGLAAGKGVLESSNMEELLRFGKNILKNDSLLVEEYLTGWEVSIFTFSDGKHYHVLPPCTDFKKAHDGDGGPNTGGMGSLCPAPKVDSTLFETIKTEIVAPTYKGLNSDGLNYKGILYFGLMITQNGPKVLEYNIRLGDPEAQVLLPMIDTDFGLICQDMLTQNLNNLDIRINQGAALGVVVAASGYPGKYAKDIPVSSLPQIVENELVVFHASTHKDTEGQIKTGGGRCFTVVGRGDDLAHASRIAYKHVGEVKFQGAWYRSDIGSKFI